MRVAVQHFQIFFSLTLFHTMWECVWVNWKPLCSSTTLYHLRCSSKIQKYWKVLRGHAPTNANEWLIMGRWKWRHSLWAYVLSSIKMTTFALSLCSQFYTNDDICSEPMFSVLWKWRHLLWAYVLSSMKMTTFALSSIFSVLWNPKVVETCMFGIEKKLRSLWNVKIRVKNLYLRFKSNPQKITPCIFLAHL